MALTLRATKGSALTHNEVDANFTYAAGIESMTDAATAASAAEKTDFLDAVGAAQYLAVRDETASFTLIAASHANRRTDASSGSAIAVTWNTGHGMTKGDAGRIMQTGAGAVTLSAGTGTVTLAPGVTAAVTTADGSWLDWEYMGGDELVVTARGVAASAGTSTVTAYADGTGSTAFAAPGAGEFTMASIAIPAAAIGANGWVEFLYAAERTAGSGTLAARIRVNNATTGTAIAAPTAASRISGVAHFVSQSSTTSHRNSGGGVAGVPWGTGAGTTDTTDTTGIVTFYLTGVLSVGTDTATKYYFKAVVYNPDA